MSCESGTEFQPNNNNNRLINWFKDRHRDWQGLTKPEKIFLTSMCIFPVLIGSDILTTHIGLTNPELNLIEGNPIARWVLERTNLSGLYLWKLFVCAFVGVSSEYIRKNSYCHSYLPSVPIVSGVILNGVSTVLNTALINN